MNKLFFILGLMATIWLSPAFAAEEKAFELPEPGVPFSDCAECPEMLVVPAGSFVMGSDGRHKQEKPPVKVTFAKPFAMSQFEVTFDNWQACVDDGGCKATPDDHNWGRGDRPVINITWDDADTYVKWLSKITGATYRKPSEAEWEYVAKAGTDTEFFWGDEPGANMANCRNCESEWSKKGSAPVGSFKANPWGFYDMHGNIWEWMADCWNPNHEGALTDGTARQTGDCRQRVIRSGSWYYFSKNMRSSWRFKNDHRVRSYGIGMRVVREID